MTWLMHRTLSSSFCKRALRVCSVLYLETPLPLRELATSVRSDGRESAGLVCLEGRDGDAKRSSVSDESERASLPVSGVAILLRVNVRLVTPLDTSFQKETRSYHLHHQHAR